MAEKVTEIHHDLIEACKKGDRKAYMSIYKLYYKSMYNTAYRILNNEPEAEDVMQEAFMSAFSKLEQFNYKATFGAWLKRIVINNAIDHQKKQADLVSLEDEPMEVMEQQDENYLEVLSYRVEDIRKSMMKIHEDYRIILSLHLLEGYDHEEISQILGISYNATRTRYSRAKKSLLKKLSEQKLNQFAN